MEGLTNFLASVSSVFTTIIGLVSDVFELFVTEPILIFLVGLMFTGAVIGFCMRVIRRR